MSDCVTRDGRHHIPPRVEPYAVGICSASVCADADASPDEIAEAVNLAHPTGITSQWRVSGDPNFATGQTNPCACERDENRRHWLLHC